MSRGDVTEGRLGRGWKSYLAPAPPAPGSPAPLGCWLEIGSGCGYQSAVLSYFANDVFAVERIKPLVSKSRENLSDLKIRNVIVKHADGFNGWEEDLKFDGIICAAAPRQYPEELLELLEIGGKLVIPVGLEGQQKLYVITKKSDTESEEMIHEEVAFVPMLPGVSNGEV